ncbi:AAA family ATPase [Heyndrickxia oleronia]|uniref:AAA family ATPase n=1 Tax=Heyndrickxia oleronia TaxID=38875 RepID=UPI0015D3874F|nr:AAA family ATPase [Heyndrickxia oleronia]MCM3454865.1 AAA family ATPase [Heyndrickxia oleronia]NYV66571.1 AAA family ATPase [Bacillus sp. Gen3]
MIVLATGQKQLDEYLKEQLDSKVSVDYLEGIEYAVYSYHTKVLIFSEFIPVIAPIPDQNQRYQAILKVLETVRNNNVRVILLTTLDAPHWFLGKCVSLGIYDIIIGDSKINGEVIPSFFYNPSTKEQAVALLKSIETQKEVQTSPIIHTMEKEKTVIAQDKEEEQINNLMLKGVQDTLTLQKEDSFPNLIVSVRNEENVQVKELSPSTIENEEDTIEENRNEIIENNNSTKNTTPFDRNKKKKIHILGDQKIIGFWGQTPGLGNRTLSQTFATIAANRGAEVLYVEMNYFTSSFAITSGLSHDKKNFYQYMLQFIENEDVDIEPYIANANEINLSKKRLRKTIEKIPKNLDFLTLPKGFEESNFPDEINQKSFMKYFMRNLRSSRYDLIVLNLPPYLQHMFAFPIMLEIDYVFNVMTLHPARILGFNQLKEKLSKTPLNMENFKTIINMVPKEIDKDKADNLIQDTSLFIVPFDNERSVHELDLNIGSPAINEAVGAYLEELGLRAEHLLEDPKKKRRLISFGS